MAGHAALDVDVFCRVVDNYGDIGVCWRLARRLADLSQAHRVRLWVDELAPFQRIEPRLNPGAALQSLDGVQIAHWTSDAASRALPAGVVVEAFGCNLPRPYIDAMVARDSVWINLEYLSAEEWVESCHALPSIQDNGLRKYFFFPGFTPRTGGLLREPNLLAQRDEWLAQPSRRSDLLGRIGMPAQQIENLMQGHRQVFLFCYPTAPAQALVDALEHQPTPSVLIVPQGVFGGLMPRPAGQVYIHESPFVDQNDFDRLLWGSDLNAVRGEDSLVRAIWAGKPLLWQIYQQDAGAHMQKLAAWLRASPYTLDIHELMAAWNEGASAELSVRLRAVLQGDAWAQWQASSRAWANTLAGQKDLAEALVAFCAKQRRTR